MNKYCEIFFSENDDLAEFESQQKEWRGDIIVKIKDELFNPIITTPARLFLDYTYSINSRRLFCFNDNLVLVEKTERKVIINTLLKLINIGFFSRIKPVDLKQEFANAFQELQDLKNWVKVY